MMKHILLLFSLCFTIEASHASSSSLDNDDDPRQQLEVIVQQFQSYIIKKDTRSLSALFLPEGGNWFTVKADGYYSSLKSENPNIQKIESSNYKDFMKYIESSENPIEEKFFNVKINTNGSIASVYFDFIFINNNKVANRGSESWQLVKTIDGWRISSMIYSANR